MSILSGECLVVTENGLKKLSSVSQERVLTDDGYRTINIKPLGEVGCFSVRTKFGYEVALVEGELFVRGNGWKRFRDLPEKCEVRLLDAREVTYPQDYSFPVDPTNYRRRHYDSNGRNRLHLTKFVNLPEKWTEGFAEFVGYLVGDGWITLQNYSTYIEVANNTLMREKWKSFFENLGWKVTIVRQSSSTRVVTSGKSLTDFLQALGVSTRRARGKVVPFSVLEAPRDVVAAFLRGLYSADGTVFTHKNATKAVVLSSTSDKLIEQCQILLLYLGIRSNRKKYGLNSRVPQGHEYSYELNYLYVTSHRNEFEKEIGFLEGEKREKLKEINSKYAVRPYRHPEFDKLSSIKTFDISPACEVDVPIYANGILVR